VSIFVAQLAQFRDAFIHFQFQRYNNHAPGTFARQLVQALHDFGVCSLCIISDKLHLGVSSLRFLPDLGVGTRRIRHLFSSANPQLSVIPHC
jgi:hypothetical protein